MVARVTRYRIRRGKLEEFSSTVESVMATMDNLPGFRGLLVLGGEHANDREAMAISVWDTAEDMKSSENNKFYYEGLVRVMNCCESFSPMHQHRVLKSKFPKPKEKPSRSF